MTHELILIHDGERILYVNPAGARILGYDRAEDVVGLDVMRHLHSSTLETALSRIRRSRAGVPKKDLDEISVVRLDGSVVQLEVSAAPVEYGGQRVTQVVGRDVTALREAMADVALCRALLRDVQAFAHAGTWSWRFDEDEQQWSEGNYRIYGRAPGSITPSFEAFMETVHPDDRASIRDALAQMRGQTIVEFRVVLPNGETRFVRSIADFEHDPTGRPTGVRGITQDVTEFQAPAAQLRSTFEAAPLPVLMTDADGTILLANNAAETVFGWEPGTLAGNDVSALTADLTEEMHRRYMHHYAKTGEASTPGGLVVGRTREVSAIRRDGTMFPADLSVSVVRASNGQPQYLGIVVDATERKRAEADLVRAQKMEALGTLVPGIVHNFNNLLAMIGGSIAMIRADGTDSPWLTTAEEATDRAGRLVRQLLQFSRRESLAIAAVAPGPVLQRMVELAKETFDRRITITLDQSEISGQINGDTGQIEQVILNLLVNARDAVLARADSSPAEFSPRIEVSVGPTTLRGETAVRIGVADNGIGMSEEVQARAMDPFFTTKASDIGTGLGLSTAAGVIAQHNGVLLIDSLLGVGSTFVVVVPLSPLERPAEPSLPRETVAAKYRILVVDDEQAIGELTGAYLETMGHEVIVLSGGMEAINLLRSGAAIDVAVVDTNMPPPNGWEVLDVARGLAGAPPIVMTSGYGDRELAIQRGAAAYIDKPFTRQELLASVNAAVAAHPLGSA